MDIRVTLADKLFPRWVTDEFMSELIFEIEDMSDPENNLSIRLQETLTVTTIVT